MIQVAFNTITLKVKGYVKANWGSPFIMGFMLLLVAADVLLSLEMSFLANAIAIFAFYALIAGVVLQLVCFVKMPKRNGDHD